jgi:hypothetical protein
VVFQEAESLAKLMTQQAALGMMAIRLMMLQQHTTVCLALIRLRNITPALVGQL